MPLIRWIPNKFLVLKKYISNSSLENVKKKTKIKAVNELYAESMQNDRASAILINFK